MSLGRKPEQCLDELGVDDSIDTRSIESLSILSLHLVPVRGKAKFLDSVLRYDLHILTGLGFATLRAQVSWRENRRLLPLQESIPLVHQ